MDGELRVIDRPAELAYRLYAGEREVGELRYARQGDLLVLVHTEVDRSLGRQGLGSTLVREALDDIRARDLEIVPRCPFVKRYLERHPEYADLVAE
jgi:predicted GNAT family acetyltransferase